MLPSKTVFIVGAGASFEVGMPVGSSLRDLISTKLDIRFDDFRTQVGFGDMLIYDVLKKKFPQNINHYLEACRHIRDAIFLAPSIDDFINTHAHDNAIAVCGKLAIARAILEAEKGSKLYFKRESANDTINFKGITKTWFMGFYQLLAQSVKKESLDDLFKNVTIITFNYDRCIEHFLSHAIAMHYSISIEESRRLMESLVIYHPYGSVGSYLGRQPGIVEFGYVNGIPNPDDIFLNLKTFNERIEDTNELQAIRSAILDAQTLVFLGNAYHPINTRLLKDTTHKSKDYNKRIFATRRGTSDTDLEVVKLDLIDLCSFPQHSVSYRPPFYFSDTCSDLFEEFRISMRR